MVRWVRLPQQSCIDMELLYIGSSWSSWLYSSMWRGPQEYIAYEFVPPSPTVSCMSGLSYLDSFCAGWSVAIQLLFCRVLPPGLVLYCSQHSCVKYFLVNWNTWIHFTVCKKIKMSTFKMLSKNVVTDVCERDRETVGAEDRLSYWPISSSLLGRGHSEPFPYRAPVSVIDCI